MWKPTNELRWVTLRPEGRGSYWLEQKYVWSPAYEEWGGATKWFKVKTVFVDDAMKDPEYAPIFAPSSLHDDPPQELCGDSTDTPGSGQSNPA